MTQFLPDGRQLILASSSPFRRDLLSRLELPFEVRIPRGVDETPWPDEMPWDLVARLACDKAQCVAKQESNALVIGSDQVAVLDKQILGKPGNHERARTQLTQAAGKIVTFFTGLCLVNSHSGRTQSVVVPFQVIFRSLSLQQIENYLHREQPYQCAGSFKAERLGIALFERMAGDDPNALIGLPLIQLIRLLETEGIAVL